MKEQIYIPQELFGSIPHLLVREQCKACNGTGEVVNGEAESLRITFAKIKRGSVSAAEQEQFKQDRRSFMISYQYDAVTEAGRCIKCDGKGHVPRWVPVTSFKLNVGS